MNSSPTSPTPERRAHSPSAGDWPLLARLPDVSGQLPENVGRAKRPVTATTDYRFDAPQLADRGRQSADLASNSAVGNSTSERPGDGLSTRLPQPHLLQRTWRVDQAVQAPRGNSAILPRSNPFAIPSASLHDALAPLVRFVMLVVLFTAAGTTILMAGKEDRARSQALPPATTSTQPLLEPTSIIEPAVAAVEQPVAATATGPSGDTAVQQVDRSNESVPAFPDVLASPPEIESDGEESSSEQVTGNPAASPSTPAASAPDFISSPLTGDGRALPQVRISEPAPAVAHLPGYIVHPPSRQANNDDEPSVY